MNSVGLLPRKSLGLIPAIGGDLIQQEAREPHPLELHGPMGTRNPHGRSHAHALLGGEFNGMKPMRPR